MTRLPDLKLGSGLSSRPLGIVVMGVDMICGGQFAFVEGVCREGFSGFSGEKKVFEEGSAAVVKGSQQGMPRSEKGALRTGRFRVLRVATIEEGGLKLKVNQ